ncbi:MAG: RuBisCO large subunit C-terminal-like domain-containing protein [Tatlockia sp.]
MSEYVKATYTIKSAKIKEAADALVIGQSIGNPYLRSKYETPEMLARYSAHVTSIKELTNAFHEVETIFPVDIFTKGSFTHFLTVVMGGQMDIDLIEGCRLTGLDIPEQLIASFAGPKLGIQGIRDKISVHNRPLIGGIVKPKTGLSLDTLCQMIKAMVDGGIDFIKEDEILGEIEGAPVLKRIEAVNKALEGSKVIYAPAINVPIAEYTAVAEALNASDNIFGYHLNVWAGLDAFAYLSSLANKVSFYQKSGDGVITKENYSIAFDVWCLLARLAGADMIHVGMMGGYLDESKEVLQKRINALQNPCFGHKGTIPSFSCGATPAHVPLLTEAFGQDIMISAGGSIHSHAEGTTVGVKAFRQMAEQMATPVACGLEV